jgi:hypothetical protein
MTRPEGPWVEIKDVAGVGGIGFVLQNFRRERCAPAGIGGEGDVDLGCDRGRNGLAGAAGLDALNLVESAVKDALEVGLMTAEVGEGVAAGDVVVIDETDVVGGVVVPLEAVLQVVDALVVEARLEDAEAAEAPGGHGEVADQLVLDGASRGQVIPKRLPEALELGRVFGGQEDLLGGETVSDGVQGGARFAFGGAGSRALAGVATIGFDLFFCGHGGVW